MRRFVIITKTGGPLVNDTGTVILFASAAEARKWVMPGETIKPADDQLAGDPAIDDEVRRD